MKYFSLPCLFPIQQFSFKLFVETYFDFPVFILFVYVPYHLWFTSYSVLCFLFCPFLIAFIWHFDICSEWTYWQIVVRLIQYGQQIFIFVSHVHPDHAPGSISHPLFPPTHCISQSYFTLLALVINMLQDKQLLLKMYEICFQTQFRELWIIQSTETIWIYQRDRLSNSYFLFSLASFSECQSQLVLSLTM